MISKDQALELLHSNMQSVNLRKHCYAVAAAMKALANHFNENELRYEIVGLLHDGDYEETKADIKNHAKLMAGWVKDLGETDEELIEGIESHGWFHNGKLPETKMQWSLYCVDELTGFIIAVTLIRPNKKIAEVTVENILSKWNSKSFAGGVDRKQIEMCEEKLGIKLEDFIKITLTSMQSIANDLGL